MNILFISALDIKEKGAQSIRMTLEGYAKAGHNVWFLTMSKPKSKDYYYEKEYQSRWDNFKIIRLPIPFSFVTRISGKLSKLRDLFIFNLIAYFKGSSIIKNEDIDIIYGYEVRGMYASYYLNRSFPKTKLVSRFQGTILYPFLNRNTKEKKKNWRRNWDHRKAMQFEADKIIMTNDGTMGDIVLKELGVDMSRVSFWMNGVNKEIYQPKYQNYLKKKYKLPKDANILITIHRLAAWKRTDRAIMAMPRVLEKHPNTYLVIVGDGVMKESLEKMSAESGLEKNVIFAGGVSNNEIGKYVNGADIYLGTYDLSNAGNPLFEAMLAGCAIISMDNGSTQDFLDKGRAGILIDKEADFSNNISKLLGSTGVLKDYQEKAKTYANDNFWTWDKRINKEISEVEGLV